MLRAGSQAACACTAQAGARPAAHMPPFLPPCHAALLDRGGIPPASLPSLDGLPAGAPILAALHPTALPLPSAYFTAVPPRTGGGACLPAIRGCAHAGTPARCSGPARPAGLVEAGSSQQDAALASGPSLRGQKGQDGRGRKLLARFEQNRGANAASDPRIAATSFGPARGRAQGVLRTRQRGPRAASRGCVACVRVSRLSSASRPSLQGGMGSRAGCGASPAQAGAGTAPQGLRAPAPDRPGRMHCSDPGDSKC